MANESLVLRETLERLHGDLREKLNDMVDAFLEDVNDEFEAISDEGEDGVYAQPHDAVYINNLEFADLGQLTWLVVDALRRIGIEGRIRVDIGIHGCETDEDTVRIAQSIRSQIGGDGEFQLGYSTGDGPWVHWLKHEQQNHEEGGFSHSIEYSVYGPTDYSKPDTPVPQRDIFKPFLPKEVK